MTHGYYDSEDPAVRDRAKWDMPNIPHYIQTRLKSRHVMLILDNCHSGAIVEKAGGDGDDAVHENFAETTNVVITASTTQQNALDIEQLGHSALTAVLLDGFAADGGAPPADLTRDGVVTDRELYHFVTDQFHRRGGHFRRQSPQFISLDEGKSRSGQFLFIPR